MLRSLHVLLVQWTRLHVAKIKHTRWHGHRLFRLASHRRWPFDAWRLGFLTTGLSSVSMRRAFILSCYFRSNHNVSFLCLKGEYWYYLELTVYLLLSYISLVIIFCDAGSFFDLLKFISCQTCTILNWTAVLANKDALNKNPWMWCFQSFSTVWFSLFLKLSDTNGTHACLSSLKLKSY